jgi:hypothetical protein
MGIPHLHPFGHPDSGAAACPAHVGRVTGDRATLENEHKHHALKDLWLYATPDKNAIGGERQSVDRLNLLG